LTKRFEKQKVKGGKVSCTRMNTDDFALRRQAEGERDRRGEGRPEIT